MSKSAIIGIIIAVLLVGGGALALTMGGEDANDTNTTTPQSTTPTPNTSSRSPSPSTSNTADDTSTQDETETTTTITYSSNGFSPATVSVKSGDTVQIKNTGDDELQLYSDPHPEHTTNDELNVGAVAPGQTESFTVTKKGTFGFHNHLDPSMKGTITVQ